MTVQWYYRDSGRESGPMTAQDLRNKALHGQIKPETHVRKGAKGAWVLAQNVRGLFDASPSSDRVTSPANPDDQNAMNWLNGLETTSTGPSTGEADHRTYSLATPATEPTLPLRRLGPKPTGRLSPENDSAQESWEAVSSITSRCPLLSHCWVLVVHRRRDLLAGFFDRAHAIVSRTWDWHCCRNHSRRLLLSDCRGHSSLQ